jgi:uncharacterized membrane protein YphA (DoxX/SURF4 family)
MGVMMCRRDLQNLTPKFLWQLALRGIVGSYWIFFSSQRWLNPFGVRDITITATQGNYIPVYGTLLRAVILPNPELTILAVTFLESAVGFMILLGVLPKVAATLGAIDSVNLTLTFSFCTCPWTESDFPLTFWFYFSALLLNVQLLFDESWKAAGIERLVRDRMRKSS